MLRNQQDRDSLPRYLETLDTSENGSAIANKTGALDAVRNDVALISTKSGPVVIAAFTYDNSDQRWTGDNEAEQTLGKLAQAIVGRWSPQGLDAGAFPWENPLLGSNRAPLVLHRHAQARATECPARIMLSVAASSKIVRLVSSLPFDPNPG